MTTLESKYYEELIICYGEALRPLIEDVKIEDGLFKVRRGGSWTGYLVMGESILHT